MGTRYLQFLGLLAIAAGIGMAAAYFSVGMVVFIVVVIIHGLAEEGADCRPQYRPGLTCESAAETTRRELTPRGAAKFAKNFGTSTKQLDRRAVNRYAKLTVRIRCVAALLVLGFSLVLVLVVLCGIIPILEEYI